MLPHVLPGFWGRSFQLVTVTNPPHRVAVGGGYVAWTYAGTSSPTSLDGAVYAISKPQ